MIWSSAAAPNVFQGVTNEPLTFILYLLIIIFTASSFWGFLAKYIEKRKSKRDGTLDEKKLEFEIDKFSIETIQKAVITLNNDLARYRQELTDTKTELATVRANHLMVLEKNAALLRYIAKAVSKRRAEGIMEMVPVDEQDYAIIPEVVNMLK